MPDLFRKPRFSAWAVILGLLVSWATAAVWTVDGIDTLVAALERLEFSNVRLDALGTVTLAPALQELAKLDEAAIWQVAQDRSGTLWLATGNSARVFRRTRTGAAPELIFDGKSGEVLALTTAADGTVYFGRTPEGTVYRIRPAAAPESLLATGSSYIFSLLTDRAGTLYCATGDQGRLITVTPDGRMRTVFTAHQSHLTTMHWLVPDKQLLVGTSPDGIVYLLDFAVNREQPEVSVFYDTPFEEVRAIVSEPGHRVYVAANSPAGSGGDSGLARVYALRSSPAPRHSSLLLWSWACPESLIFALALRPSYCLLVGTGHRGIIYELDTLGRASLLHRLSETQALFLGPSSPRPLKTPLFLATGNGAKLYQLGPGYADSGYLVSPPHDCNNPARFGSLAFRGTVPAGTRLEFDTRSGFSQRPDSTWTDWAEAPGKVLSPSGRFIQWRARFSSRFPDLTPSLTRTDLFYGAVNRPPQVKRLDLAELPLNEARRGLARPKRTITWETDDPDSDSVAFELYFKGDTETRWKLAARDLTESRYELDTRALADGWYSVRLVVSDRPDQPDGLALSTERTSRSFLIDNTPPQVVELNVRHLDDDRYRVSFTARDGTSPIVFGRVAINAGDWQPATPEDGLLDSPVEHFTIDVRLPLGESVVAVWVADAQGNVGVASTTVLR